MYSAKKVLLDILQNSQEKNLCQSFFFIKKNTFYIEHLWENASHF